MSLNVFQRQQTQSIAMNNLNKVILSSIRRNMPAVIAKDILSVQPMTDREGDIFNLGVKRANPKHCYE